MQVLNMTITIIIFICLQWYLYILMEDMDQYLMSVCSRTSLAVQIVLNSHSLNVKLLMAVSQNVKMQ